MKLFVIKDMKAQLFLRPHFYRTTADALRAWETTANEPENQLSKFPNDFRLFEVAKFSDDTGVLEVYDRMNDLGSVFDFQKKSS